MNCSLVSVQLLSQLNQNMVSNKTDTAAYIGNTILLLIDAATLIVFRTLNDEVITSSPRIPAGYNSCIVMLTRVLQSEL